MNDFVRESIPKILEINRNDYEILLYPDKRSDETWPKTRQIASGPGGPAMKRSLAIRDAQGDILIFMDDDAYPNSSFLDQLEEDFEDGRIVAVGGPGVTPNDDGFWQMVSGAVFLSSLSGGFPERYVPVGSKRFVDDWPSVNLSVRKQIFDQIGGFDSHYWPGEDTKFCLDLIEKTGKKILYDPQLIACHHRREGLWRHLKQVGNYGLHRGFFVKRFPKTSCRFKYFLPSIFLLYLVGGALLSWYFPPLFIPYLTGLGIYGLALAKALFDIHRYEKNLLILICAIPYIFLTHLSYGLRFIQGLLTPRLKSRLR
ncbi:MAG: glycosyltransferase [bacterium]|nr:glycosyltransferase [bacterium]